jgi:hypothetical protein
VSFPFLPENLVKVNHGNLAMLYAGCALPDYKNIYIFGTQQVRSGVGPLITPAAKLLAKMIKLQDEMQLPIGLVMKESGAKLPTTHRECHTSLTYPSGTETSKEIPKRDQRETVSNISNESGSASLLNQKNGEPMSGSPWKTVKRDQVKEEVL